MNRLCHFAFAGLLAAVAGLAQISTPITPVSLDQVYTTGMISFTSSQTAQLNVLNISPVPASSTTGSSGSATTTPGCSVQLSFYDSQNRLVKQSASTSLAPQTATTLDLTTTQVPAASQATPRIAVRGVVEIEPATSTVTGSSVVFASSCQLFTTLELFDTTSGLTQSFSSDTRQAATAVAIPLAR